MTGQLTWLVTGCSSGLGEALVRAILAKGDKVIATARPSKGSGGAQRLAALETAGAAVLELEITASQEELNAKAKEAWSIYGQVDILVNNGGYIEAAVVEEMDDQILTNSLRTNVHGPLNLSRAFLPLMRARKTGTLIFSGSLGVYHGAPGASPYIASKGLLDAIVPNLALEIASFGLRACILVLGNFRTEIMAPGNIQYSAQHSVPEYAELNHLIQAGCAATNGNQLRDPRKAAELIVEAVRGEGRCMGKELPLRLPLGSDAFEMIRAHGVGMRGICDEWEPITSQTNAE